MAHISEDIKLKRRQALLTQQQVADGVGVHVNTMRKIERGDENVQLDILIKVCDFLDYKLKLKLVKK